jgi:hypothetical protein
MRQVSLALLIFLAVYALPSTLAYKIIAYPRLLQRTRHPQEQISLISSVYSSRTSLKDANPTIVSPFDNANPSGAAVAEVFLRLLTPSRLGSDCSV